MNRRANPQQELRRRADAGAARCARSTPCTGLALAIVITSGPLLAAGDEGDAAYVHPLVNQALETEKTDVEIPWANPETGKRGVIVVERTFYRDEQPCRDYRRTVEEPGSPALVIEGTGCRVGPGRWELDEEPARKTSDETAVEPAAGPARGQPEPEQDAQATAQSSTSEPEAASETEAASEPEEASEKASAEPPVPAEDTPPEPPPFPDYTMPSAASL